MRYIHLIFLALFTISSSQGQSASRRGLTYWLRSKDAAVTIHMRWDPAHCSITTPLWYSVELCTLQRFCRTSEVSEPTVTFEPTELFPLMFWNVYIATINVYCGETGWSQWSYHQIHTGPGELMPLHDVRVSAGAQNATISWGQTSQLKSESEDSVEISVCHASTNCLKTIRTHFNVMKYTIDQLSPGVDYSAELRSLRLSKDKAYRSKPVIVGFRTGLSNVREFPAIDDFAVQVLRRDSSVDLELRFTKPKAPYGALFRNVVLNISDDRNNPISTLRTRETSIGIQNLPYSTFFAIDVQAVYDHAQGLVESAVVSKVIGTGPRVFPDKPRILQVMSISNSSALIRWSNISSRSANLSCKISLNNGVSKDIESLETGFMVIDKNLEPSRDYNVTLVTLLPGSDGARISFLEQKQFRMLPEDALVAKPVIENIAWGSVHLKWEVTLPEDPRDCRILIRYHSMGASGGEFISDPRVRSTRLEFHSFEQYSITMNTTCTFHPDIVVFGVSRPLEVSAAAVLGPPLGVTITTVRGQRIVQWMAEGDNRFRVACYKVEATSVSTSKRTVLLRTKRTFELSALEPRHRYVLRISACIDAAGQLCGASAELETTTTATGDVGYPSRPTVELVSQEGGNISIRWSVPTEPKGPIDGYEYAYGRKGDSFSPTNWVTARSEERSATVSRLQTSTTYIPYSL